jgi:hypothetical protein
MLSYVAKVRGIKLKVSEDQQRKTFSLSELANYERK